MEQPHSLEEWGREEEKKPFTEAEYLSAHAFISLIDAGLIKQVNLLRAEAGEPLDDPATFESEEFKHSVAITAVMNCNRRIFILSRTLIELTKEIPELREFIEKLPPHIISLN